ncbi:DUF6913 domain-containing protein [Winogradskyella immobilis]|uniref:Uncharacterized protein n=1 Tax=Winogradskyella immobilis TaxID=2816852 RepID=A0ABS8ER62_9FLAO|nr:hypothetical protein [Winogradskyella immobilis]MCC1484797.1 hypothetical protein [Winogradskyella immobilis]MCG0016889.1 hypothetical protein [Winogradskyella immobilis]
MILRAFKEKSNQKYINNLLATRKASVNDNKIITVGVLLNAEEYEDLENFNIFFKSMNLNSPKHKILIYSTLDSVVHNQWDSFFGPKDIGWKGKIKNIDLQSFIDETYDVLISYYKEDILELNQVVAMSKANFKVGISNADERLYDLIIDVKPKQFQLFKTEFVKYLNILNKL